VTAALSPQLELDDSGMRLLLEIVGDPARLTALMQELEKRTENSPGAVRVGAFLNLLRGLAEYVGRTNPAQLDQTLRQVGNAAGRLTADGMLELLLRRQQPEAMAGNVDVVSAMVHRMSDGAITEFVVGSVVVCIAYVYVLSATGGTVQRLFTSEAGGLMVYASDPSDRFVLMYAHLDRYASGLANGMPLQRGDTLGFVGTTGNAPRMAEAIVRRVR